MPRHLLALAVFAVVSLAFAAGPPNTYRARVQPASQDYLRALKAMRVPAGLEVDLWAAEPMLANPVAFAIDHKGRMFVAETFRLHAGVTDIRGYLNKRGDYWLDDDLACRTVEDRVAMMERRLGRKKAKEWAVHHDRIRLIEDTKGTGKADRATVFADGFSDLADGIAAGVLARGDTVWYACIPHLWQLRDTKGDGIARERKKLSSGYGVHIGFIGHDLHGLVMGPDGKLYFSIGDRGLNVKTREGKHLDYPDTGCVLRCNPDGSDLEVFASGLRNPQELAFDRHGNLFTCDNNSDSGDRVRWTYVMPGGDHGWRIGYQFDGSQGSRGPWNAEKLWHPPHAGQPAWIVPPIANLGDGPSGLVYYPGVGLPPRYNDHFFLADFRGGPGNSGIRSFANKPKGAGFELTDSHEFIWRVLATDVDFGPDGSLYVSDWVDGWGLTGKGRIWKFTEPSQVASNDAKQTKALLNEGFTKRPVAELARLLGAVDGRVRQEAHLELAARGKAGREALEQVASRGKGIARIHAIWGLGIAARGDRDAMKTVPGLLTDADEEVRANALRVLGENRATTAAAQVIEALKDESVRVRSMAALALARIGDPKAVVPVANLLRENNDADPWLRHAGVMALAGCGDRKALNGLATHESAAVRRGALLAMRRQGLADIARFLDDADPEIVTEAARAISDAPIPAAFPKLAALIGRGGLSEAALYRVLNAQFRLGEPANAVALARYAARSDAPPALRREAVRMLDDWERPNGRDRVLGIWRPLPARKSSAAEEALRSHLGGLFTGPDLVRKEAVRVVARYGIKEVGSALYDLARDTKASATVRGEAMIALESLKYRLTSKAVAANLEDTDPAVRSVARDVMSRLAPDQGVRLLKKALDDGTTVEKQRAFDTLGGMRSDAAAKLLGEWMDRLVAGKVPAEARLDLTEAAGRYPGLKEKLGAYEKARPKGEPFGPWRDSQVGGDAEAGREVFLNKAAVSCVRCHKAAGLGTGEVGPDLTGIGAKQKRDYLLESIVHPNKQIAKGFETVDVRLRNGQFRSGIVKSEDVKEVRLITPEGTTITIRKDRIESRTPGKSAMPEDLVKHLSRKEVRDLVEFLASLKEEPSK